MLLRALPYALRTALTGPRRRRTLRKIRVTGKLAEDESCGVPDEGFGPWAMTEDCQCASQLLPSVPGSWLLHCCLRLET